MHVCVNLCLLSLLRAFVCLFYRKTSIHGVYMTRTWCIPRVEVVYAPNPCTCTFVLTHCKWFSANHKLPGLRSLTIIIYQSSSPLIMVMMISLLFHILFDVTLSMMILLDGSWVGSCYFWWSIIDGLACCLRQGFALPGSTLWIILDIR